MYTLIMLSAPDMDNNNYNNGIYDFKFIDDETQIKDHIKNYISYMTGMTIRNMLKLKSSYTTSYGFTLLYNNKVVWYDNNNTEFDLITEIDSDDYTKYDCIFQKYVNELRNNSKKYIKSVHERMFKHFETEKTAKIAKEAMKQLKDIENSEKNQLKRLLEKYPEFKNG